MHREEIEAMWERIKALEENVLKVCKGLGEESIRTVSGLSTVPVAMANKDEAFNQYISPRLTKTLGNISNAQDVDRVVELVHEYNRDCVAFVAALLKHD